MKKAVFLALAILMAVAPGAWAQLSTGNIYGNVTDESGAVLPGATVNITGANIGGRSTTSGSDGGFRFLNLDNGSYKLSVTLTGFTTVNREVIVNTGQNVNLTFGLKVATVEETVTVTAETPVVDTKKMGTSTTLTKEELNQIPNSRDPWAILRTIPGVVVDRVNIAGNESGQQSSFSGKGSDTKDSMWNIDGVNVTDTSATGASPTYYDYDAFDEIAVTTGGSDLKVQTGGIGLNFVTKRGTNNFHGGVHGYFTNHDLQTSNTSGTPLATDARLKGSDKADHIDQIADYGADLGGPLVKDKLWFWGSYGKQDIRNARTDQTKDKTLLKDINAKLNWQASSSDMVSLFFFQGAKEKFGRSPGISGIGTYEDDFLWNQGNQYKNGVHGLYKLEDNHVFSPNFFLNVKAAYYGNGFGFTPRGGADKDGGIDYNTSSAFGSYVTYQALRPESVGHLDANYFKTAMGGNHEFKFGFGYRSTPVDSITSYSGDKLFGLKYTASSGYAYVTRDRAASFGTKYYDAYVGDTFTKDRLTLNVGVRWDRQTGGNNPSTAAANPAFPNLLPDLNFPGTGQGVKWNDFAPRAGLTYALDQSRKTVLRASYARYAGQLGTGDASYDNPLGSPSYLAYNWVDLNGDHLAQPGEILISQGIQYFGYVDPTNPASATSPNKIDPNYKANHDNEYIVGLERELAPNFGLSMAYTHRNSSDITGWTPRIDMTSADYTQGTTVTRNGFSGTPFKPNSALIAATGGGRILENRPDYSRKFDGFEASFTKRLSNKWMSRVAGAYSNWTETIDSSAGIQNPTRQDTSGLTSSGPQTNGGQVAPRSSGSGKGDIFYSAKWQIIANALYQLPAGFEFSGALFGRQGYPRPIVLNISTGGDGTRRVLANGTELDTTRYDNLWNLDLRLSKNLKIAGSTSAVITADCFNVLNNNVVLNQVRTASSSAFNRVDELLSPRVFRFGVRLTF